MKPADPAHAGCVDRSGARPWISGVHRKGKRAISACNWWKTKRCALVRLVSAEQQRIVDGAEQALNASAFPAGVQDNQPGLCQCQCLRQRGARIAALSLGRRHRPSHRALLSARPARSIAATTCPTCAFPSRPGNRARSSPAATRSAGVPDGRPCTPGRAVPNRDGGWRASPSWRSTSLAWGQQSRGLPCRRKPSASIADRNGTIYSPHARWAALVGRSIPAEDRFSLEGNTIRVAPMRALRAARGSPPIRPRAPTPGDCASGSGSTRTSPSRRCRGRTDRA